MFDYIVIGAGFAGAVIAERIAGILNRKVLVIEKRDHIGGNCYDYRDKNNIIIHKYGPHLFHTDCKKVFDYLSNFTDWHSYHHRVLAFVKGKKVPVPFNFNSMDMLFPAELSIRLQKILLKKYPAFSRVPILEMRKTNDRDLQFLANFIYEQIFMNYTVKQWGKKPEEITPDVTARVPVVMGRDDRYFTDKYQAVPAEGYTKIFERMLNHPDIKLMLNTDFKKVIKLDFKKGKTYFSGQEFKGKLIFTGMIDELCKYRFEFLPYRSLEFKFETIEKEFYQEVAVVNYPNDYDFTRITEFKHIHPVKNRKTTIVFEYPREYKVGDSPYYPMFTDEVKERYYKYMELSQQFENLILVGRLAEYRYYDMDDVIKRALEVFGERMR